MRDGKPTGSLPRSAAACMTLCATSRKRRNVKGNDARRGGAFGERGAGAKKSRREAGQDSYRRQMPKVRRAESRLGESRAGSRGIHMQGMRRGTKDILMRMSRYDGSSGARPIASEWRIASSCHLRHDSGGVATDSPIAFGKDDGFRYAQPILRKTTKNRSEQAAP
jgi:hypothetical protein